jgi:hypothetical protein
MEDVDIEEVCDCSVGLDHPSCEDSKSGRQTNVIGLLKGYMKY